MSLSNLLQNQPYQRSRRQSTSTSCQTDPLEFPNSLVASSSVIETTLTEDNVVLLEKEVETVDCEIVISEEEEVILQAQPLQGIEHKSSPPNAGPIFMDEGVQVDYQHFDTPTVQQPLTVAVVENSTSTTDDIVDSVIDNINNTSDSTTSITNSALSAAVVALGGVAGAASAAITTAVPVIASVAPASALATGTGVLIAQAVVVGAAAATATAAVAAVMTVASKENGDQEDESLNCNQMHEDIDQRDDLPGQAPHEELAETETDSSSPPATILHQEEVSLLSTFEDNIKNSGVISSVNNSSGIKNHNENSFVNDDFVHDFLQPIVELAAKNAFPLDTLQKPIRIDGVLEFDENGVVIEHEEEMTTNMHENEVQGEISEVSLSYTSSTPLSSPISRPGSCGSSEGISARRSSSASTSAFSNNSATASSTTSAAERASWKQSIKRRARRPSVDMRDFAALALAISSRFSELESCHKLMHTLSSSVVPTGMFTSSSLPSSFSSFSESTRISPALRAAKQSYISTAHGIVELGKGINRAWLPIAAGCTDSVLRHQLVSALTKLDTLSSQMRAVAGSKDADLGDIDTSASVVSAARNVLEASSGALSALEAANVCFTGRDQ